MADGARWFLPRFDSREIASLASELKICLPAAGVLYARGLRHAPAARAFLNPSLDDLHDPLRLAGMEEAIERLRRAIRDGERILIYGDYDVDGTTSVVILKKAIELAGGAADYHIPNRLTDGYGMRPEVVEAAAAAGTKLIVSVDTGIRATEVVRRAAELGIDVIITDHHLPEQGLPPALAVLNPNRPDCGYPDKNLCGVGVAFKLVQGLLATLNWPPEKLRRVMVSFLKLVALGTVADVVPLTGENRILVKHGLDGLRSVKNPGLRALLGVAGFTGDNVPSATQVAFRIAPRINAAGRMDTAAAVIELFTTENAERARLLAGQLHALNAERQQAEREIVEQILEECTLTPVDGEAALVFCREKWHRGVLGIVASRLVERFHRPAFVLSSEDGRANGSGRGIPGFHLLEALESMADLFEKFGGHAHAAGITLPASKVDAFRERLGACAAARLTPEDFLKRVDVDAIVELGALDDRSVSEVFSLAPFGHGNPRPLFAALDVEIAAPPAILKEKHLRFAVRQDARTLRVKGWNFADRAAELRPGARIDIAFTLEEDAYAAERGYGFWTAVLREFRACGTDHRAS